MEKEFIPYEQALALKELGFNEQCIATYDEDKEFELQDFEQNYNTFPSHIIAAPLYQQAFRWFREKYKFHAEIRSYTAKYFTIIIQELKDIVIYLEYGGIDLKFNTYEEAELECLKKLIEIVKN
jgi:hypothetical protein